MPKIFKSSIALAAASFALVALTGVTPALAAEACATEAVTARGENSRFMWSAKAKARANWRRRVRGLPGLGPAYDTWSRAQNTDEQCFSGPAGTLCIFTGTPCKR